jgi:ABC-type bacteriocin/lantibiotic exporter with double-glycine peptidase domain
MNPRPRDTEWKVVGQNKSQFAELFMDNTPKNRYSLVSEVAPSQNLVSIWHFLQRAERRRIIGVVSASVVTSLLEVFGIALIVPVLTIAMGSEMAGPRIPVISGIFKAVNATPNQIKLTTILSVLVLVFVAKTLFQAIVKYWQLRECEKIQLRITNTAYSLHLKQPALTRAGSDSSMFTQSITDAGALIEHSIIPIISITSEAIVATSLLVLLLSVQPAATIAALAVGGIFAVAFMAIIRNRTTLLGEARLSASAARLMVIRESVEGTPEIQVAHVHQFFQTLFEKRNNAAVAASYRYYFLRSLPGFGLEVVIVLGAAVVSAVLALQSSTTSDQLIILTLYFVAGLRLIPTLNRVTVGFQDLRYGKPLIKQFMKLYMTSESRQSTRHQIPVSNNDLVRFEDVVFRYSTESHESIDFGNLAIANQCVIGISGPSGVGKSTLIHLLVGLLDPTEGRVRYREDLIGPSGDLVGLGFVPQSPTILNTSVRENIIFGRATQGISDNEMQDLVQRAAVRAGVLEFIDDLDSTDAVSVGEKGSHLSGGQRQRLGIARAILFEPRLIVLDEATNALDEPLEAAIISGLIHELKNSSLVLVTHNKKLLALCDEVITLG